MRKLNLPTAAPRSSTSGRRSSNASLHPQRRVTHRARRQVRRAQRRLHLDQRGALSRRHLPRCGGRDRAHRLGAGRRTKASSVLRGAHGDSGRAGLRRARRQGQAARDSARARAARFRSWASATACSSPASSLRATSASLPDAMTSEVDETTPDPVIDFMPEQRNLEIYGGTMRLGAYACTLDAGYASPRARTASSRSASVIATATSSTTAIGRSSKSTACASRAITRSARRGSSRSIELAASTCIRGSSARRRIRSSSRGRTGPSPLYRDFIGAALAHEESRSTAAPALLEATSWTPSVHHRRRPHPRRRAQSAARPDEPSARHDDPRARCVFARSHGAVRARRRRARRSSGEWTDFVDARRFALAQVETPWTLMIDADEALDDVLREAILDGSRRRRRLPRPAHDVLLRQADAHVAQTNRWCGCFAPIARTLEARTRGGRRRRRCTKRWRCDGPRRRAAGTLLHYSYPDVGIVSGEVRRATRRSEAAGHDGPTLRAVALRGCAMRAALRVAAARARRPVGWSARLVRRLSVGALSGRCGAKSAAGDRVQRASVSMRG